MHVITGSTSDRKIAICQRVFAQFVAGPLTVRGHAAASGVPETPFGAETLTGARNRAHGCQEAVPQADFWVGLESGLVERFGQVFEEAWGCVLAADGREAVGYSSGLCVPAMVLQRMQESGRPHFEEMAVIEQGFQLPHDTWSNYSGGLILREVSLAEALRNALIQQLAPPHSLFCR